MPCGVPGLPKTDRGIARAKSVHGLVVADQNQFGITGQPSTGQRGALDGVSPCHGHHGAVGLFSEVGFGERSTNQLRGHRHPDDVESFGHQQRVVGVEVVPDRGGASGRVGEHGMGPGPVEGRHFAIEVRPCDQLDVGSELAAVDREVDVDVVVVGGDHHTGRFSNTCLVHLRVRPRNFTPSRSYLLGSTETDAGRRAAR